MATIKDIARTAGVSQGTVSNVLNGHANVSLEKIQKVRDAAAKLGYTHNKGAAALRSGVKSGLAVVLPDIQCSTYGDFFAGFCEEADVLGQTVQLYLTGNVPRTELHQLRAARKARLLGIAAVSSWAASSGDIHRLEEALGDSRTLFIERQPEADLPYLGFDFAQAGLALAQQALAAGCKHVGIMTGLSCYPCEQEFFQAASAVLQNAGVGITHVQAITRQYAARAFELCQAGADGVIASSGEMAACARAAWASGSEAEPPVCYVIAPRRTFYANEHVLYEMDYRLLGRRACRALMNEEDLPQQILPAHGLRSQRAFHRQKDQTVRLLTQDSSFTQALRQLAPGLRKHLGLDLKITCFPRNELFDVIHAMGETDAYDLIRMDVNWIDWYGKRLFTPLTELPLDLESILSKLVPGLDGEYTSVDGIRYLLPLDPSALFLFYRRDLFEDPTLCRSFYETTRHELTIPDSFEAYNRLAAFFTRSINPASRTPYGCTTTHIASEFMPYLLGKLPEGHLLSFNTPECIASLELYLQTERYAYISSTGQWINTADQFIAGNCAMTILFTNFVEHIVSNPMSHVAGRVSLAPLPGPRPFLGGGVIGIPQASRRKEAASRFLEWVYHDDISQQLSQLSGSTANVLAYQNPEILSLYPWLETVKASFQHGIRRGIYQGARQPFNGKYIETHIALACRNAADGVMTPKEAMEYVQGVYEQMR